MFFLPKSQKVLTIRHEIKSTIETTRGCVIVIYFSHKMTDETISVLLSDNAYGLMEAMRLLFRGNESACGCHESSC